MNGGGASTTRWLPKSFSFVANSTTSTVTFTDVSTITANVDLTLDNVRIVTGNVREVIFNTPNSTPVTLSVSPADRNGASGGSTTFTRSYNVGTVLTISAPATNFVHWERNGTQFSTSATTSYTVNGNEYVTAVYTGAGPGGGGGGGGPVAPGLTVNSTPNAGVNVTVSPADTLGRTDGPTNFNRTYADGTVVTLTTPHTNFVRWALNGVEHATNPTTSLTISGNQTLTAVYTTPPVLGPFTNGSFENDFNGWTWTGGNQTVKVKTGLPATDGAVVVEFNSNSSGLDGAISQTFITTPGTVYTVTFDMGVLAFNTQSQRLQVTATGNTSLLSQTISLAGIGGGNTRWSARTATFTANSATTTLTFRDQSTVTNAIDLLLDNVTVSSASSPTVRNLTVDSTPVTGVAITCSPVDITSTGNGSTQFTRSYNNGTVVTLTAPATASGATFLKWQRNGVDVGTNVTTTVTMDANHLMTAVYNPPPVGPGLNNRSFELGLSNWTVTGGAGAVVTDIGLSPTNGTTVAKFNGSGAGLDGAISQAFTTVPGTIYVITFDLGVTAFNTQIQRMRVTATGSSALASRDFSITGINGGTVSWSRERSVVFTADSTTTTVAFRDISTTGNSIDMLLDNIRMGTHTTPPAGTNLITNGSFENLTDYAGWTLVNTGTRLERPGAFYATNGTCILSFNVGMPTGGKIEQSFPTVPGTTYRIQYDVGTLGYNTNTQTLRTQVSGTGDLLNRTTTVTCRADYTMVWVPQTYTFVANTTTSKLTFTDISTSVNALDLFVDSVYVIPVTSSSPTPSSALAPADLLDENGTGSEPLNTVGEEGSFPADSPQFSGQPGAVIIKMLATKPGTYLLESCDDLSSWAPNGDPQTIAEPQLLEFQDNSAGGDRMFYRIKSIIATPAD
jgi:hypothetical protein